MPDEADKCRIFVGCTTNIQHFFKSSSVCHKNKLKDYYYGKKRFKERARTP